MTQTRGGAESQMGQEGTKSKSASAVVSQTRVPSTAITNVEDASSPPHNGAGGMATVAPRSSTLSPTTHQKNALKVAGNWGTYTLREEIGHGAYGRVYLSDVVPNSPVPLPPSSALMSSPLPSLSMNTAASSSSTPSTSGKGERLNGSQPVDRVVLKRMTNASVEDGLQAATLREIMVLSELTTGSSWRDRMEREAFRCGRAVFQSPASSLSPSSATQEQDSKDLLSFPSKSRCEVYGGSNEYVEEDPLSLSSPVQSGALESLTAEQRHRISRGRKFLIGIRDTIMLPQDQMVYVAMEYCEGGDLWHFLRDLRLTLRPGTQKFGDVMPIGVFRRWAVELILALAFLHSHHIAHRDLKPQNLMLAKQPASLDSFASSPTPLSSSSTGRLPGGGASPENAGTLNGAQYTLKVGDFGLSRMEDIPYKKYVHEAVTLWYRSPDVLLGNTNYTYTVDAWSLGCILIEMASGSVLFKGRDETDELCHIFTRGCRPSPSTFPRMREYRHYERYADIINKYYEADDARLSDEALLQAQVSRLSRHLRLFLQERQALHLVGDAGVDFIARLLILDPERRMTILDAMSHPFFTAAYTEVYGAD